MRRRRGLRVAIVLTIVAALGLSAVGDAIGAKRKVVKTSAVLNGTNEVPPADPDGTGTADFKLKTKKGKPKGKVCFKVNFQNIGAPFVAHIHPGEAGVNGPPLITLFEDTAFTSPQEGCVKFKRKQIKKIGKHPDRFYINIHNTEFQDGAIRGQLQKGPLSGGGGGYTPPPGGGTPPPNPY
jgi:CHRD domain